LPNSGQLSGTAATANALVFVAPVSPFWTSVQARRAAAELLGVAIKDREKLYDALVRLAR
jgi:hypothetical protein